MTEFEILKANIAKHGVDEELTVAAEECAELIQAITKIKRYGKRQDLLDHLAEEMADVTIVLDEIVFMFDNLFDMKDWRKRKLERMNKRLEDNENG